MDSLNQSKLLDVISNLQLLLNIIVQIQEQAD